MSDLDLGTVRAFVAITEDHYFSEAAARLGISQQAVSKRIARLESDLGVRLFFRSRNGAELTADGRAFLHHARALIGIADQALEVLRGRRRSLRVDVLDTRLSSVDLVRAFHQSAEGVDIEITTSNGLRTARDAIAHGSVDVAFARFTGTPDEDLRCVPAYLEPVHLLVDRDHPFAGLPEVPIERLSGTTVWMPGNAPGSEWAEFYRLLEAAFDIEIDATGPDFGWEYFVEEIGSGRRVGFAGEGLRLPWHPRTVQIPIVGPAPVYPCSLLCHRQNHHAVLSRLIDFVTAEFRPFDPRHQWLPDADRAAFTHPH
ncbi:DNA-binding transcriptional regulator, LysR family [Nonomuraea solani]|uniref:DNA-binding transcriptional regulator, LysR family n=1 Tax=Nonomuraea solani TaxID=1144553 RepID=A0A1H6EVS4_9ACTN|nr:LysR family transcriptional regulator [Nonomuraea solani]SEH01191.1 DNA-binding transcriptional regulator, LysR family [Nonomuraea solani]